MSAALHPKIQRQLAGGKDLLDDINKVSAYLSELMQEAHGGKWSVSVNHENCFVLVARDFSESGRVSR